MKITIILLFSLSLLGCGLSKDYISSVPTMGEKVRGPLKIIHKPELAIHLKPNNDLLTNQFAYFLFPIFPIGWDTDDKLLVDEPNDTFKIQLALFAYQDNLFLNFSDIRLNLQETTHKVANVVQNPYAYNSESQARSIGDKDIYCQASKNVIDLDFNTNQALSNDGLWECYDLVFPVSAPYPEVHFQMEFSIKEGTTDKEIYYKIPFEHKEWGFADSFP
ncbi:MAG: hypothetical protein ABW092_07455 [Candidatus Thiodiazotropha sp.]